MKVGLLWFDNDKSRTLTEKVARAAAYYQQKYEVAPTLCYVHPSALEGAALKENGVEVRAAPTVLPDHFWIGVEEKSARAKKPKDRRIA